MGAFSFVTLVADSGPASTESALRVHIEVVQSTLCDDFVQRLRIQACLLIQTLIEGTV